MLFPSSRFSHQRIRFGAAFVGGDEGAGVLEVVGEHIVAGAVGAHEDDIAGGGQCIVDGDSFGHGGGRWLLQA